MNIFAVDPDPFKCAAYLDDKRVVKMILESAQMLCTAIRMMSGEPMSLYTKPDAKRKRTVYVHETDVVVGEYLTMKTLYVNTHENHPCNVWARKTDSNFGWLYDHMLGLLDEYEARYEKRHSCETLLPHLMMYSVSIPIGELTPHPNCTTYFRDVDDVNEAYRLCMQRKWDNDKYPPKWSNRI